jgi:hypothetical protein
MGGKLHDDGAAASLGSEWQVHINVMKNDAGLAGR